MGDLEALSTMPGRFREIVAGMMKSQRYAAWSSVGAGAPAYFLFRDTQVQSRVFLATREKGGFFSFRRPAEEEVVLDGSLEFSVRPSGGEAAVTRAPVRFLTAVLPPFLDGGIPLANRLALAEALGESNLVRIVFLKLGLFYLAAVHPEDIDLARVAYMWHGAPKADVVFQRVGPQTYQYAPDPFLMLLAEVARWTRGGFAEGPRLALRVNPASKESVPQFLHAVAATWESAVRTAGTRPPDDPLADYLPAFGIAGFQARVTLRLGPDGQLARKKKDDTFRLGLAVAEREGQLILTLGLPDFLLEGDLYEQLLEKARHSDAAARLFAGSGLPKHRREAFGRFLHEATVAIFRARKEGNRDTEVFVFEGAWDGETRTLAASLAVEVRRHRELTEVKANPKEIGIVFHNLIPKAPQRGVEFPRFVLALVHQLHAWRESLE